MRSKTMLDASRGPSKKQIRTSKLSVFIVLAGQMRNSQHWRGYQQAPAKKSTIHNNTANEEGQKPCWKSLGHLSKKQIRTSKISVFIVLAGQMRNSQHWRGYQQAPAKKSTIHNNTSNE